MPRQNKGAYLRFIKRRGAFYIQWYEAGTKRQRSTGTADVREAEGALAKFILEQQRAAPRTGPRDPGDVSIAEILDRYEALHAPSTAAPARIGHAILGLLPFWEVYTLGDVSEATCRDYARARGRSPGTVRRELGTLRAAINFAHRHGELTRAPHVFLPSKPEGRARWLTRKEAAQLLHAALRSRADSRLYLPLFVVLALYTGARKDALLSLRWPQIDFANGRIDLNPPGRKRTNKGRAVIPMPDRLRTFLRLARRRGTDLGYVIHRDGHRLADIGSSFARACRDAGLEDVTPHTLRHTCGTWMAHAGVDLWEIAGWLGQTHARTTELYAHHHPDHLANARRASDRRR